MVKITQPIDQAWSRANARAVEQACQGRRAVTNGCGRYLVPSSVGDGRQYQVRILNVGRLEATCTCEHARSGKVGHCWHVAAAIAAEIRRVSRPANPIEAKMARFSRA